MEIYNYKYAPEYIITKDDVEKYLLGKLRNGRKSLAIYKLLKERPEFISKVIKGKRVLAIEGDLTYLVEVRSEKGYYKLRTLKNNITTIEINGIHMHKVEGIDPLSDANRKVRLARTKAGHKVLDICTGLGYTAIASMRRGAQVTSIEADENVLWIAERNPWSRELESKNIIIILGDAIKIVNDLPNNFYDRIIHDPPKISKSSGQLYSHDFYLELFRILKNGGILYHYTGKSGRLRRLNILGSVASRLKRAGFHIAKLDKISSGIVAKKL